MVQDQLLADAHALSDIQPGVAVRRASFLGWLISVTPHRTRTRFSRPQASRGTAASSKREQSDSPESIKQRSVVHARITDPAPGAVLDTGTYTVRGKAWSGSGPVTRVDISLTGEGDWLPAQLETPQGPYQWQNWSFEWNAVDVGRHTLRARATDAAGNTQPDVPPWNRLGYGNNAIEVQYVDVQ